MTLTEFLVAAAHPLRSPSALVALLGFYLLLGLAALAGAFGIWLTVAVVPALFRYLVMMAEARAHGRDSQPPGVGYFSLAGSLWTLFPAVPAALTALGLAFAEPAGAVATLSVALVAGTVIPAMMAVLVITHSPAQSLNPTALLRFVREVGAGYAFASIVAVALVLLPLEGGELPIWFLGLGELYLAFALYSVIGTLIEQHDLLQAVDVPRAERREGHVEAAELEAGRAAALNHAYGFFSRDNRRGALAHLDDWLTRDPDPGAASAWFFERMLEWERKDPALYFAQVHISRLLAAGDDVRAVKVMLRCRLFDTRFRPLPEDRERALQAAEGTGNAALARALADVGGL